MMKDTTISLPADQPLLVFNRSFDAPLALLWKVNTDPYHLSRWWAPIGYRCVNCKVDLRVGGIWRHEMRGGDTDNEFVLTSLYLELVEPTRIVYRNAPDDYKGGDELPPPWLHTTITLSEANGRSSTHAEVRFPSIAIRDEQAKRGFADTVAAANDILEAYLKTL